MEEPPRIGRDGFQIATLGLRIQRPEREGRLSRSGDAGEDDEGIARDFERDVLEIVLAGAPDANEAAVCLRTACTVAANQGFVHPIFLVREGRNGLR